MEVEKHVEEFKQYISNTIKGYEQESWAIKQDWKYENLDLDEKIETINDALCEWSWEYDPSKRFMSFGFTDEEESDEYASKTWSKSMDERFEYMHPSEIHMVWMFDLSFFIANESWHRVEQEFKRYIEHVTKYETKELIKHDSDFPDDEETGNALEW